MKSYDKTLMDFKINAPQVIYLWNFHKYRVNFIAPSSSYIGQEVGNFGA